jgi:hypothetical protein
LGTHNKIRVASKMFTEAHNRYVNAKGDIDYIASILLSGAVMGIVSPLLREQGGHTSHELLAKIAKLTAEQGESPAREGLFRAIYNGLKHAGDDRQGIAASEDLELDVDLPREAAHMLDDAKADFKAIAVARELRAQIPQEFFALVLSDDDYA